MAINLDDRYPGRANGKTTSYPQGSFKNRTSPTAKDGTYLEEDWANDQLAFFQSLISDAGLTANGTVDVVGASQYFDALMLAVGNRFPRIATFTEVNALVADEGPIVVYDMDGTAWTWVSSPHFTGYRSHMCGEIMGGNTTAPRAFQIPATGGTWLDSDPKAKRVIAHYREQGLVVPIGDWKKGQGMIADLGSGAWKAPDLQDMFLRMSGTDADTANAATTGVYKKDTLAAHKHSGWSRGLIAGSLTGYTYSAPSTVTSPAPDVDPNTTAPYGTFETAPVHSRVAPYIHV